MPLNHTSRSSELTELQYAALGKIVVEWSNIEYLLGVLLSRLLCTPEYLGRTYVEVVPAVRVQSAIVEAVAIHRHRYGAARIQERQLKAVEQLMGRVSALRVERNKVSHLRWARLSDDEVFGAALAGGAPDAGRQGKMNKSLTAAELSRLRNEAHALTEQLIRMCEALPVVPE